MFASVRPALKYTALIRAYIGQGSSGGEALYASPIMIKCYPSVENKFVMTDDGGTVVNKSVLYVSADVPVNEEDLVIFENASPNWLGRNFEDSTERDSYYALKPERLVAGKTWCCIDGTAQYWDGSDWSTDFDGIRRDGELVGGFEGKTSKVKSAPKYFDGFGWDDDAENSEGLSIQEIEL